jgi:hypothetical protein
VDVPTLVVSIVASLAGSTGLAAWITTRGQKELAKEQAALADGAADKAFDRNQRGIKAKEAIDRRQAQTETVDAISGHVSHLLTWFQQRPTTGGVITADTDDEIREALARPRHAQDTDLGRLRDTQTGQEVVYSYHLCLQLFAKAQGNVKLPEAAAGLDMAINRWRALPSAAVGP